MEGMGSKMEGMESKKASEVRVVKELENGLTKVISIREIENGFIIKKCLHGEINGKYIDKNKEYYSKENPIEIEVEQESGANEIKGLLNSIKHM